MDILCTTGGDNSMTLTEESLSSSRRQRTNAFKAALDAEYADRVLAGTIERLELVLSLLETRLTSKGRVESLYQACLRLLVHQEREKLHR